MAKKRDVKEWTLMFYIAGDNELAPIVVSQLKAIKDAGFQENTDVLVHFDPNELGVPTRIYNVNRKQKRYSKSPTRIGDGADPFVHNMEEDDVDPKEIKSAAIRQALINPDAINAEQALENFLSFCRENHPAKRYMLVLLGHGMVVGSDAFLPDDNPVSAITLKELGRILNSFCVDIKKEKGSLELLALHSCSLSAIEVAYELKGTANYMIASEGPSFVGSWPYRQLLKKIFKNLEDAKKRARRNANREGTKQNPDINILKLVKDLYFLTLFAATDFMLAGYSLDLALCSLDKQKIDGVIVPIQKLVDMLIKGLKAASLNDGSADNERGKRIKELVLLAHWEAQSYWGENYTDLFDFCRCLRERCGTKDDLEDLRTACSNVIEKLEAIVIHSENFGSKFQYSHGLSIYFPWSRPIEAVAKGSNNPGIGQIKYKDEEKGILERYRDYAFTQDLGDKSWLDFLETYFDKTKRQSRLKEDGRPAEPRLGARVIARRGFDPSGVLSSLPGGGGNGKPSGSVGAACTCSSIKNYPEEITPEEIGPEVAMGETKRNVPFAITEGPLQAYE